MSELAQRVSILPVPFCLQDFQFLCAFFTRIWKSRMFSSLSTASPVLRASSVCGTRTTSGEAFIINTNKEMLVFFSQPPRFTSDFLPQSIIKIPRGQKPFKEFHVEKQQNTIKYQAGVALQSTWEDFSDLCACFESKCEQETQNCSPTEQNFSLEGLFILKMWHYSNSFHQLCWIQPQSLCVADHNNSLISYK